MQENEIMYVYLYIFLLPSVTNGDFATQSIRSGKTKGQGKERSNAEAREGGKWKGKRESCIVEVACMQPRFTSSLSAGR